jgi:hypothetical protein
MKKRYYSRETGGCYLEGLYTTMPSDVKPISEARFLEVFANPPVGTVIDHDAEGLPIRVPELTTEANLLRSVDDAADKARRLVVGDTLRAIEYQRAADQAAAFQAAGYQGPVPSMVAAWAVGGRTPQQAAEDILREAAQYNGALELLRTTRLQAKVLIRKLMAVGNIEQAQDIAAETIASIEAAVAGIGNNT